MKKGYFFVIDATLAIAILITGYFLMSSSVSDAAREYPMSIVAENTFEILTDVRISDVCTGCSCSITELGNFCTGIGIYGDRSMSLLDFFGELYARTGSTPSAEQLFIEITNNANMLRSDLYHTHFAIDGVTIYDSAGAASRDDSHELIITKRILLGYYENGATGNIMFWGPYLAEMEIWPR